MPTPAQPRLVLSDLLAKAADTAFGRDHGFAEMAALPDAAARAAAFRARFPFRDYEGLKGYVERVVAGEHDVLWPGLPKYFCKTSGTTSGAKYIPLTEDSLPNHIGAAGGRCCTMWPGQAVRISWAAR